MDQTRHNFDWLLKEMKDSVNILVFANKLLGSMPFYVNVFRNKQKSLSIKMIICSVIQISFSILITGLFIYAALQEITEVHKTFSIMTNLFIKFRDIFTVTNLMLIYFGCHFYRNQYEKITGKVFKIHQALCINGELHRFIIVKKWINLYLFAWLIIYLYNLGVVLYEEIFIDSWPKPVVETLLVVLNPMQFGVRILSLSQYLSLLFMIKFEYKIINSTLTKFYDEDEKLVHFQTNLVTLRKEHLNLSLLMDEINRIFQMLILSSLLVTFGSLSLTFYILYRLVSEWFIREASMFYVVNLIGLMIIKSMEIFVILLVNEILQTEKDNTGKILYKMLLKRKGFSSMVSYSK